MRGEFNEFFIVKQIKKVVCALFSWNVIRKRLEHSRRRKKHWTMSPVSPKLLLCSSRFLRALRRNRAQASLFYLLIMKKLINLDPSPTITLSDFVVIVMISGVSEVSHYSIGYMFKERRYTSNLMYSSWRRKSFRVFKVACSIMKSRKAFWGTRAYSRIFIDNIGNKDLLQKNISKNRVR